MEIDNKVELGEELQLSCLVMEEDFGNQEVF